MILLRQPVRALLSLIVTMISLSVLYLSLGAPFVAMVNLIVYAGAVLVLFLFAIMLQGIGAREIDLGKRFHPAFIPGVILTISFFDFGFLKLIRRFPELHFQDVAGSARQVGKTLFTQYLLPFELVSILLILAILAAVALAKREDSA